MVGGRGWRTTTLMAELVGREFFYNCSLFANFSLVKICFQRQCIKAFTAFLCITVLNNALFLVEASNHISMYSAPKPGLRCRGQPSVLAGQILVISIVYLVNY